MPASISSSSSSSSFETWLRGSCSYHCSMCDVDASSSIEFWQHVQRVHALTVSTYTALNPKFCRNKTTLLCALCGRSVSHDQSKLSRHFTRCHPDVSLKSYYDSHVANAAGCGGEKRSKPGPASARSGRKRPISAGSTSARTSSVANTPSEEEEDVDDPEPSPPAPKTPRPTPSPASSAKGSTGEKSIREYFDKCKYKCSACGLTSSYRDSLERHVAEVEGGRAKVTSVSVMMHTCGICSTEVQLDSGIFMRHLEKVHGGTTLREYLEPYLSRKSGDGCSAKKKVKREKPDVADDEVAIVSQTHKKPPVGPVAPPPMPMPMPAVVKAQAPPPQMPVVTSVRSLQPTQKPWQPRGRGRKPKVYWYEGCKYRCNICAEFLPDTEMMGKHMEGAHQTEAVLGNNFTVTQETTFACEVGGCGEAVLHTRPKIKAHVEERHKLSLEEYAAAFGKK